MFSFLAGAVNQKNFSLDHALPVYRKDEFAGKLPCKFSGCRVIFFVTTESGDKCALDTPPKPRLLEEVRSHLRTKRYSLRTEKVYLAWIRRFILDNGKRHPRYMGAPEVERFLSLLATVDKVAASIQNQALSALLFLYRVVLGMQLPWMEDVTPAKRPKRVPTALSHDEITRLLAAMDGRPWLLASLLYGTGMRLMECLGLRVKDVDCRATKSPCATARAERIGERCYRAA